VEFRTVVALSIAQRSIANIYNRKLNNFPRILLGLLLLACSLASFLKLKTGGWLEGDLSDFQVYETAAHLVREHRSIDIYSGATAGEDPQKKDANPQSPFSEEARMIGINRVQLYLYPPTLADLLVPLTYLSTKHAGFAWTIINLLCLLSSIGLLIRLLNLPFLHIASPFLILAVFTFHPVLAGLAWGQIVIVMLFLWTLSLYLYARGWKATSAAVLALATAIKLTPIIAILPMIVWCEWRWIRSYLISLIALLIGMLLLNSPQCVKLCFLQIIPEMSNGIAISSNFTILSACGGVYESLMGWGDGKVVPMAIPRAVLLLGKAMNFICLMSAVALVVRSRRFLGVHLRVLTLSLFCALSVILSPVSWQHAYTVCLVALALLWAEVLQTSVSRKYVVLLTLTSFECSWFALSFTFRHFTHGLAFGLTTFVPILLLLFVVLYRLGEMSGLVRIFDLEDHLHPRTIDVATPQVFAS
jgi:hypothetical protein